MDNQIVVVEQVALGSLQVQPSEVVRRASAIATELADVINNRKLYTNISGKKYVRVDGWTTLGAMLGVLAREVSVTENEAGDIEAVVELIRAADGMVIGRGSAILGNDESTWKGRPHYARRSMAITRATGKAFRLTFSWIIGLAGYETTPAEEMDYVDGEVRPAISKPVTESKPATETKTKKERPYDPETLVAGLNSKVEKYSSRTASQEQRGLMVSMLEVALGGETSRKELTYWLNDGKPSSKDLPDAMVLALLDWLKPIKDSGGAYTPDVMAVREAGMALSAAREAKGQLSIL